MALRRVDSFYSDANMARLRKNAAEMCFGSVFPFFAEGVGGKMCPRSEFLHWKSSQRVAVRSAEIPTDELLEISSDLIFRKQWISKTI